MQRQNLVSDEKIIAQLEKLKEQKLIVEKKWDVPEYIAMALDSAIDHLEHQRAPEEFEFQRALNTFNNNNNNWKYNSARDNLRIILDYYSNINKQDNLEFLKCIFDLQVLLTLRWPQNERHQAIVYDVVKRDTTLQWNVGASIALPSCGQLADKENLNDFFRSPDAYAVSNHHDEMIKGKVCPRCPSSINPIILLNDYEINYLIKNGINVLEPHPDVLEAFKEANEVDLTEVSDELQEHYNNSLFNNIKRKVLAVTTIGFTVLIGIALLATSIYFMPPLTPLIFGSLFGSAALVGGIACLQRGEEYDESYFTVFAYEFIRALAVNWLVLSASAFLIPWAVPGLTGSVFSSSVANIIIDNLNTILAVASSLTLGLGICIHLGQTLYHKLTSKENVNQLDSDDLYFLDEVKYVQSSTYDYAINNTIIRDLYVGISYAAINIVAFPFSKIGEMLGIAVASLCQFVRAPLAVPAVHTLDGFSSRIVDTQQNIIFPPNTANMQRGLKIDPTAVKPAAVEEESANDLEKEHVTENQTAADDELEANANLEGLKPFRQTA